MTRSLTGQTDRCSQRTVPAGATYANTGAACATTTRNESDEKRTSDELVAQFGFGLNDAAATLRRDGVGVRMSSPHGPITLRARQAPLRRCVCIEAPPAPLSAREAAFHLRLARPNPGCSTLACRCRPWTRREPHELASTSVTTVPRVLPIARRGRGEPVCGPMPGLAGDAGGPHV
jgi:hypothetical protein